MASQRQAQVIGAGIAGLAAATALAQRGWMVTLSEAVEDPSPVGAGLLIQPTGLAALDELGLGDALRAQGARVNQLLGTRRSSRTVMDVNYRDVSAEAHGVGIHRGALFEILMTAAVEAGVTIRTGTEVTELDADADLRVVANGRGSSLRHLVGETKVDKPYPWGAVWAIVPDPDHIYGPVLRQVYDGPSLMLGALPTGQDPTTATPCLTIFWSLRVGEFEAFRSTGLQAWKDELLGLMPELEVPLQAITEIDQLRFATYGDVVMRRWHRDSTVVIGDAAHAMSPQLGQGANLGLIDAVVLAKCLDAGPDVPAALAEYSQRRRAHLRYYQAASRWLTPFYQSDLRWLGPPRDLLIPLLGKIPYTRRQMALTMAGMKTGVFGAYDHPAAVLNLA